MRFVSTRDNDDGANASYDDYDPLKTPPQLNQSEYETSQYYYDGGAIRAGGPPKYTSPEVLALLSQYVAVGLLYGALPNLAYPLFTAYFHLTGAQYNSATALVSFGWTLKVFVGMLSDCVPICGYRRKSWMMIGWSLCCACLVVLSVMDHGPSYATMTTSLERKPTTMQDRGAHVAMLFAAATICYIIADVPADALVVEVAQREPMASRGRMQSLIYTTRTVSSIVSQIVIGVCLNSPNYGGSFSWDMGMNALFVMLAIASAVMVPISCFFVKDIKQNGVYFSGYLRQFWELVQRRATWQVMLFNFFFNLFASGISSTAAPYVKYNWAKVENLGTQLTTIASNLIFAIVLAAMGRWGLDWNWRWVIVLTTLSMNLIDATVQYMTIYDIVRNQWFYLGVPVAEQLPYAMQFIVTTFVIVELAEIGNEGITYGLLTTVSNLPLVFGPVLANIIFGGFKVDNEFIREDSAEARAQVAYTYLIYYSTTVFACVWVFLMPSQKAHVHELKVTGGKSPLMGGLVLFGCSAAMLWSVVVGILGVFESTNCLVIAGGQGCKKMMATSGDGILNG